jgi:TRAP-type C4-dicarboxylate transport system substrate-binding protein
MLYTLTFVLAMNKNSYARLPDDLKAVVDANSGLEFSVFAGRTQQDADAPARAAAVAAGNTITTITDPSDWIARTAPIYDAWVAEMAEKGIDGQALIDEAKALMAAHDN